MSNIDSNAIKIYPSAKRSTDFDYNASHITEDGIARKFNDITDINSYRISGLNVSLKGSSQISISKGSCIIDGYKVDIINNQAFSINDIGLDTNVINAIILQADIANGVDEKPQDEADRKYTGIAVRGVEKDSESLSGDVSYIILAYATYSNGTWLITQADNAYKIESNNLHAEIQQKAKITDGEINNNLSSVLENLYIDDTVTDYSTYTPAQLQKSITVSDIAANTSLQITRLKSPWGFASTGVIDPNDPIYLGDILKVEVTYTGDQSLSYKYRAYSNISYDYDPVGYCTVSGNLTLYTRLYEINPVYKLTLTKTSGNSLAGASISVYRESSLTPGVKPGFLSNNSRIYPRDKLNISCVGDISSFYIKSGNTYEYQSDSPTHQFHYSMYVSDNVRINVVDRWLHWVDIASGGYNYQFLTPDSVNFDSSRFKQTLSSTSSRYSHADPGKLKRWDITVYIYDSNVEGNTVTRTYSTYSEESSFDGDWSRVDGPIVGYGCQFYLSDVYAPGQNSGDDYVSISVTGLNQLEIQHYYEWKVGPPMPQYDVTYITGIDVNIYQYQKG